MFKKLFFSISVGMIAFSLGGASMLAAAEGGVQSSKNQVVEVDSWISKKAKSDKDVAKQFTKFRASLKQAVDEEKLTKADETKILQAVSYAADKHQSQFRNNAKKTPYVIHPIGVADNIVKIGKVYDVDVIIAALLHDVMDGTDATYEEITEYFGEGVAKYVKEVSADLSLSDKEQKKRQVLYAAKQSKGAAIIRLSDKLHNLTTLIQDPSDGWTREGIDRYFLWAHAVVDQLPKVNDPLKEAVNETITAYWNA